MKEKNKREIKSSLYIYIGVSFVIILIAIILSTLIYFKFGYDYISDKIGDGKIDQTVIDEATASHLARGIKSAILYASVVGVTLIIIVARRIIIPITKLTEATKKVAVGEFDVKVNTKRRDEIGDLTKNFNLMVNELNSIDHLRKDFVRNVSHELKTPIASIQGFAKLLADDNISKQEKDEYINIILEETSRLSNLSSNMLKLSKFENQEIVTNKRTYKLDEQLRKAIMMFEEQINQKNIKITLTAEPIIITQDEDLIMEIWINLLNNAVKYTEENGEIEVIAERQNEYVIVQVKDNGIGIEKEKQTRIFERFYQAESSHATEGSGLGLAIVKRIVELTDSKIEIESEKGKGTTFRVYLESAKNSAKEI